mmetsp:Transcript_5346/g.15791  ORF Transcript_5346/g.15791 Transcript_5346/m.15791 type:complete len:127 (+) Transcript_5346:868-1248(+)
MGWAAKLAVRRGNNTFNDDGLTPPCGNEVVQHNAFTDKAGAWMLFWFHPDSTDLYAVRLRDSQIADLHQLFDTCLLDNGGLNLCNRPLRTGCPHNVPNLKVARCSQCPISHKHASHAVEAATARGH